MNIKEYVYSTSPQVFNPDLANLIGLNEAIIFQQIIYWCRMNKESNRNFHDGHYWCYNSYKEWHESNFKYFSESTIKRAITNLESMGLLITGNYNKLKIDKTKWYRPNFDFTFGQPSGQNDLSIGSKDRCPEGQIEQSITRDYTENNSETTTNISTSHEVGKVVKKPSLTTKVKELFNSYYEDMYHQKFVWDGNPLRYGRELKIILANAGNVDDDEKFSRIQSKMAVCRYLVETKTFKFNVFDLDKLANKWNEIVIPVDKDAEQCKHLLNVWNKLTGQEIAYTPAIAQMMTVAKNRNNLGMLQKAVCAKALNQFDIDNNSRNLATLLLDKSGQIATYAGKYDDQKMSGLMEKRRNESHSSNSPFPEISHTSNYKELIKYDWMQHGVDALAKYVIGQDGYRRLKDGEKIETLIEEIMAKKISEYSKQGLVKNG